MEPTAPRPAVTQDVDVDVCVIGGGIAGLTAARELARRGWSVGLLEAHRIGLSGAAHSAGFVSPGFPERIERIIERVGLQHAKELWALSREGAEYVRATIRDAEIDEASAVDGRLDVLRSDREGELLRHAAMMRVDFDADCEVWSTEQVREFVRSSRYFQGLHLPSAFHVHTFNYTRGLARAAEAAGARIFEEALALGVDSVGIRKIVVTPGGRVRAANIVLTGGAHVVFPRVADTVVPVSLGFGMTAPFGSELFEALRYSGAVAERRRNGAHYRIVDGDKLLWGGRIGTRASSSRLGRLIEADIRETFPQLGPVSVQYAWPGLMSYAVHQMPLVGEVESGVWLACAFGSHGMNSASMAGELIARAIVEGDDRWRLFAPFELVWAGGSWGRAAARVLIWSSRIRHAATEMLTRRRAAAEEAALQTAESLRRARARARRRAMLGIAPGTAPAPPNAPAKDGPVQQPAPTARAPEPVSGSPGAP
jgi:glycine/D-amino acid oxidase-like deaminating enzyme